MEKKIDTTGTNYAERIAVDYLILTMKRLGKSLPQREQLIIQEVFLAGAEGGIR